MIDAPARTPKPEATAMPHRLVLRPASAAAETVDSFTVVANAEVAALCRDATTNAAPWRPPPAPAASERQAAYGYD